MAVGLFGSNTVNNRAVQMHGTSQVVTTDGSGNVTVNYGVTYADNAFGIVAMNGDRNQGTFFFEVISKGTSSCVLRASNSGGAVTGTLMRIELMSYGTLA